jgi:hypothetical protein
MMQARLKTEVLPKTQLKIALLFSSALLFSGCVTTTEAYKPSFTVNKFSPVIGEIRSVSTGNDLFVEGVFIPGEILRLSQSVSVMIPGSMLIPFPARIEASDLRLFRITRNWRYYCADESASSASFPGLGSVVRSGDCIGIRISSDGERKEWVVDNSIYNRGRETIWTLSIDPELGKSLNPQESPIPFDVQTLKKITFDGFYGNQLHFTWTELTRSGRNSQKFTFDFQVAKPVIIGIKGYIFEVQYADNVGARYKWIEQPLGATTGTLSTPQRPPEEVRL